MTARAAHEFRKNRERTEGSSLWEQVLDGTVLPPAALEQRSQLAKEHANTTEACVYCHKDYTSKVSGSKKHKGIIVYCGGVESKVRSSVFCAFLTFFM